jgi:integrase
MEYLEHKDLAKLFRAAYAANKLHHLAMLTAFFTGARVSQVLRLRGEDIFEANGRVVIKVHAAKRGNQLLHTLHRDELPEFDMTPLIELAKTKPLARLFGGLTRQYLNLCLKKYCASVGIHSDFGHSHVFRHSAAMTIWDATTRLGAISHFLQHKSPATACIYLAESDGRHAQAAMDNLRLA